MISKTNFIHFDWDSWTPAFEDTQLQAYYLWKQDGESFGGADHYYFRAESLLRTIYRCEGFKNYLIYIYKLRGHNI